MRGRSRCNEATGEEADSRSITGWRLADRGTSDSKAGIYLEMRGRSRCNEATGEEADSCSINVWRLADREIWNIRGGTYVTRNMS